MSYSYSHVAPPGFKIPPSYHSPRKRDGAEKIVAMAGGTQKVLDGATVNGNQGFQWAAE